jgi:hypothetical protein
VKDDSTFVAPLAQVTAANDEAARDVTHFDRYGAPTHGFVEQVSFLRPQSDPEGTPLAVIHNKAGTRGASIQFSTRELPYLTLWKNVAAKEDGYVTGIEPGTNFPNNWRTGRNFGRVPKLPAGASHRMTVNIAIYVSTEEVTAATDRIATI